MAINKRYKVASLGLSAREQRVLKSIFGIVSNRPRSYELSVIDMSKPADIYIVNAEDKIARAQLRQLCEAAPRPALLVTEVGVGEQTQPYVRRPMVASKVLAALDSMSG